MKKAASIMILVLLAAALLTACSSDNGGGGVSGSAPVISAKGGEGTAVNGGSGAYFYMGAYEGNNIVIKKSGSVDTTVDTSIADAIASSATLTFGATPMIVTTNTTVKTYPTDSTGTAVETGVAEGEYHMHGPYVVIQPWCNPNYAYTVNNPTLYKRVENTDVPVTGIHVHPGATLTFQPNYMYTNACIGTETTYDFTNGLSTVGLWNSINDSIWNQGTITVQDLVTGANEVGNTHRIPAGSALDMPGLDLETNGSWVNDGSIVLNGKNAAAGADGGNGGWFYGWADIAAVNKGTINTSGGNGDNGGDAGSAEFDSEYGVWNSGAITAKGGTGNDGYGGDGAWVGLYAYAYLSPVYNSAAIDVSGGNGTTGGGNAGSLDFSTGQQRWWGYSGGDMVNSGSIIGNGGNATVAGSGGSGADSIYFQANGANVRNSGSVNIKGGNGMGAGSWGGNGGYLYAWTDVSYDPYNDDYVAAGSVLFSGNILADGGAGETGGGAGELQFYQNSSPATGDIQLIGYSSIDISGGKGAANGGNGGSADIYGDYGDQYAASTIYNDANFNLSGGQGLDGAGGGGGNFYADSNYTAYTNPVNAFMFENRGDITTAGGAGTTDGGSAGRIDVYSNQNLKNTGHLNAKGGAASDAAAGAGGSGSSIYMWAIGGVVNTGMLETSGGNGALTGGNASYIDIYGEYGWIVNSGNMFANGGNANAALLASTGGNANIVYLYSSNSGGPFTTKNTGLAQVAGGTGATPGVGSIFVIDGTVQ